MSTYLFMHDAAKSPNCPIKLKAIADIPTIRYEYSNVSVLFNISVYINAKAVAPIVPAIHPSIDFLGLTLLNLCFPNLNPIQYANMSVPHDAINM